MKHRFNSGSQGHERLARGRSVRNVLLLVLLLNALISAAKIIFGYLTHSVSILSDGYHSLFDGVSNVLGIIGIYHASHPPDEHHPYGHGKYEAVFTIFIGVLMVFTCVEIFKEVYHSLSGAQSAVVTPGSFALIAGTLSVNVFITLFERRMGRRLKSEYLFADAKHSMGDIYSSLGVIAGLVLSKAGFPHADPVVGAVVGFIVAKSGIGIIRESIEVLVDRTQTDIAAIREAACLVKGVVECHEIRTRGSRGYIFVDMHVIVSPSLNVGDAHRIADEVEEKIKDRLPEVVDVVVHIEPDYSEGERPGNAMKY